jgi:hypothetical protein
MNRGKTAAVVLERNQLQGMICHESLTRHFAIRAALRGIDPETIIEE